MTRSRISLARGAVAGLACVTLWSVPGSSLAQAPDAQAAGADMSAGTDAAAGGASAQRAQTSTAARTTTAGLANPEAIYGLRPVKGPRPVVQFDEAMGLALQNNFDLRIAQERLVQTQLLIRKAWSTVLPRLSANVAYNFSWPEVKFAAVSKEQLEGQARIYDAQAAAAEADGNPATAETNRQLAAQTRSQKDKVQDVAINPVHVVNGGLTFSVVLFNGRAFPLLLNAYDTVKQTRATLDRARTQALYLAALGFYQAVASRRLANIAAQQVENLEKHLASTKVRVEVGALPPLALRRAQVDLTRAASSLRSARGAYESAIGSLGIALGAETLFDVGELPPIPVFEERWAADELIARAEKDRPDIQAARINLQIAERGRMDALARWLPTVQLSANARGTSNVSGFQREPLTYSVVLNASIPIYDGGERYTAYREANSRVREAELTLAQARQRLELGVRGNLRELELRKQNLILQRESLALTEASARDARARFEVGAATNLEVLDAEQLVVTAALDLAQAELELQMSRLALAFVVGAFNPPVAAPGQKLPPASPVVGMWDLPPDEDRLAQAPAERPAAPPLAPARRAANMPVGGPLPVNPSPMDLLRTGVVPPEEGQ
ncbi:MAG: TolC family protein [Myxococcota bacterium]